MTKGWWLLLAVALPGASGIADAAPQADEATVTVRAVRFFRPASGVTRVEGIVGVRLADLFRGGQGATGFRLEVALRDSSLLELQRTTTERTVPAAALAARGTTMVETFGFDVAPGRYRIHVRAVPENGTPSEAEAEVVAYTARPAVSDLLIGTAARVLPESAEADPSEVRRAGLAVRTAPMPALRPEEAGIAFYAELYRGPAVDTSGELVAEVVGGSGRSVVRTPPRVVRVGEQGGVARGSLDLAGLPAGRYELKVSARFGDSTVSTSAPFTMAAPPPPVAAAERAGDPFEGASELRLDSLYAPLVFLMDERSQRVGYQQLTVEGKRRFLREFWRQRDPTPGTPDNAAMDTFYRDVTFANEAFREGGAAAIPGWRTDRGRIYLRNGRPDEVLRRPLGTPRPYEAWKYTRGRSRYYVFSDQTGLGHYRLANTNDRNETGLGDWERYFNRESMADISEFLGGLSRDFSRD